MSAWGILAADVIVMATLDRFNPFTLDFGPVFGTVIVPAVYAAIVNDLGWDTAVSVNEETREPRRLQGSTLRMASSTGR